MKFFCNRWFLFKLRRYFPVFLLLALLFGCGNDSSTLSPYNPFSVYNGKNTPADLTEDNVSQLGFELYFGATLLGDLHDVPLFEAGEKGVENGANNVIAERAKRVEFSDGDGGSLVSDMVIDRNNGKAEGTVTWDNYRLDSTFGILKAEEWNGCVVKGSALVSGVVDLQGETFSQVTFSFQKLRLLFGNGDELVVTGKVSWVFDDSGEYPTENMTMDMDVTGIHGSSIGLYRGIKMTIIEWIDGVSVEISGRYYSAGLGYVNVLPTPVTLYVGYGTMWPVYGVIGFDNTTGKEALFDYETNDVILPAGAN